MEHSTGQMPIRPTDDQNAIDRLMSSNWVLIIGAALLGLGLLSFLYDYVQVSAWGRLGAGFLASVACCGVGVFLTRRGYIFGEILLGLGGYGLFIVGLFGTIWENLFPDALTYAYFGTLSVLYFYVSRFYSFALSCVLGVFVSLMPLILTYFLNGGQSEVGAISVAEGLMYQAALGLGFCWLAQRQQWTSLLLVYVFALGIWDGRYLLDTFYADLEFPLVLLNLICLVGFAVLATPKMQLFPALLYLVIGGFFIGASVKSDDEFLPLYFLAAHMGVTFLWARWGNRLEPLAFGAILFLGSVFASLGTQDVPASVLLGIFAVAGLGQILFLGFGLRQLLPLLYSIGQSFVTAILFYSYQEDLFVPAGWFVLLMIMAGLYLGIAVYLYRQQAERAVVSCGFQGAGLFAFFAVVILFGMVDIKLIAAGVFFILAVCSVRGKLEEVRLLLPVSLVVVLAGYYWEWVVAHDLESWAQFQRTYGETGLFFFAPYVFVAAGYLIGRSAWAKRQEGMIQCLFQLIGFSLVLATGTVAVLYAEGVGLEGSGLTDAMQSGLRMTGIGIMFGIHALVFAFYQRKSLWDVPTIIFAVLGMYYLIAMVIGESSALLSEDVEFVLFFLGQNQEVWASLIFGLGFALLAWSTGRVGRYLSGGVAAVSFLWCALVLCRGYFFGEIIYLGQGFLEAELYCYSLIMLLFSFAAIGGAWKLRQMPLARFGVCFLLVTLAKFFFIDLAVLTEEYRSFAFMCLGASILGDVFLYQKLRARCAVGRTSSSDQTSSEENASAERE